ncbi:glycosyltransferase family 2 protein [Patescibacteria group bacterium]|nr:glycosyltransferase family 2 protein [Patescibacteria group bacterium]
MIKKEAVLQRVLQTVPGILTWAVLTSPLWLGYKFPLAVIFLVTFLCFFWVYRAFVHTIGSYIGYKRYKKEVATDWSSLCRKLPSVEKMRHLILIPAVNESYEVLKNTLGGIVKSDFPKSQIIIALTCEERGAKEVKQRIETLKKEFNTKLPEILFYTHPAGIAGEAIGAAAANRTWGGRHAVAELKKRGENITNYIFTTYDADAKIHPKFLSRLTYAFLTDPKNQDRFYQTAVFLYDNNIWDVPPMMRIQSNSVTMAILSAWIVEPQRMQTFSAYSISLNTLIEADFWDVTLGVDDTTFFWRAYLAKDGNFSGKGLFVPVYSDAVQGSNWLASHKSQYKQLVRWGWGVVVFPLAIKGFLKNRRIPVLRKLFQTYYMVETYTLWITITFLVSFGIFILYAVNPIAKQNPLAYSIPKITSTVLTFAIVLLIPNTIIKELLVTKKPANWPWWKKAWSFFESPLVIINLLTYSFIPYIHAETKYMLGKKMKDLYFTEKVRTKKQPS